MEYEKGDVVQFELWRKKYCTICESLIMTMYQKILALGSMTENDDGIRTVVDDGRFVRYPERGKCEECDPNCVLGRLLSKK